MKSSRRELLAGAVSVGLCAALPVTNNIGGPLDRTRSYLLPGLWMTLEGTGIRADIEIHGNALLVVAWKDERRPAAFAITERSIRDGNYLHTFRDSMESLRVCVEQDALYT